MPTVNTPRARAEGLVIAGSDLKRGIAQARARNGGMSYRVLHERGGPRSDTLHGWFRQPLARVSPASVEKLIKVLGCEPGDPWYPVASRVSRGGWGVVVTTVRHNAALALICVVLVACGGSPTVTTAPTQPPPQVTRVPSLAVVFSPADVVRIVGESIDLLYCADEPKSDWCDRTVVADGHYSIGLSGTELSLDVQPTNPDLAEEMCHDIAVAQFDENGTPLGFESVVLVSRGKVIAECDVP